MPRRPADASRCPMKRRARVYARRQRAPGMNYGRPSYARARRAAKLTEGRPRCLRDALAAAQSARGLSFDRAASTGAALMQTSPCCAIS